MQVRSTLQLQSPFALIASNAAHCHREARQLSRDSWLHFADAETEAWRMAVTHMASSCQGEVRTRPLWLSESGRNRPPFPFPLCFSTPQLPDLTTSPLPSPMPCHPSSGRSDWPAWVMCSSVSQSMAGGLALSTNGTSHLNSC